jgi:DNA-binding transcriptional MocR family regulator
MTIRTPTTRPGPASPGAASPADLRHRLGDLGAAGHPIYAAIAAGLRRLIERGELPAGTRLPPERRLADALDVSRGTVVAAYDELRAAGLVQTRHGSGTVVDGRASPITGPREAHVTSAVSGNAIIEGMFDPSGGIDLRGAYWIGTDDLPADAFDLRDDESFRLRDEHHGYYPAGLPQLREAIARHLTDSGLPTTADQVLVTTGAQQAMSLVAQLFVERGDTVVLEEITFPGALTTFAGTAQASLVGAPMRDDGVDVDALDSLVRRHAPRLAYLVPTMQNPTGTVLPPHACKRLVESLADWGDTIVIDDRTLAPLTWDDAPPPLAASVPESRAKPLVLTIGSVSKIIWGGLRVGWVRGPEPTIARLARVKAADDLGSPVMSQLVTSRLLPRLAEIRAGRRAEHRARYAAVAEVLRDEMPDWTWAEPAGGLTLWAQLPDGASSVDLAAVATRHQVGIMPGVSSSVTGRHGDFLRIPFGYRPDVLTDGMQRVAKAWRDYVGARSRADRTCVLV